MVDWSKLLADGNFGAIVITIILLLASGGLGAAIVTAVSANRRGIRGDALVKEQNGIDGLNKLSIAQGVTIARLDKKLEELEASYKAKFQEQNDKLDRLEQKLNDEIEYSNLQTQFLMEKGYAPLPRPDRS